MEEKLIQKRIMSLELPLSVKSVKVSHIPLCDTSQHLVSFPNIKISDSDFIINVKNIATYRVTDGDYVTVDVCESADEASVNLFLNGSLFGALLHQRALLSLHGCSFVFDNKGIIICGNSGVGKSTLSYALCKSEGQFINDDITPLKITKSGVKIVPINTRIKLWDDTLKTLGVDYATLDKIRPEFNKFYVPSINYFREEREPNHIIILAIGSGDNYMAEELTGFNKYNAIRKNIYRKSYLKGMPETEKLYFKQLFILSQKVRVTRVVRPMGSNIIESASYLRGVILSGDQNSNK